MAHSEDSTHSVEGLQDILSGFSNVLQDAINLSLLQVYVGQAVMKREQRERHKAECKTDKSSMDHTPNIQEDLKQLKQINVSYMLIKFLVIKY